MLPKEIQDILSLLPTEYQAIVRPIFLFYEGRIDQLEAQVKELKDQLSKNSSNSSKPPSTDEFDKPSPKSRRKKSSCKAGGQKGHEGNTLKMVACPDEEVLHKVDFCACCQQDLRAKEVQAIERRQVYDLPPLELLITEHQIEVKRCCCGHVTKGDFPVEVQHYVQYGPNIKKPVDLYARLPVAAL